MNILICSVGRRVNLIKYFKDELRKVGGKIVAADCDPTAPALQFADNIEIVPPIDDPNYIQKIKELCGKYEINAILSLIDPELGLFAEHKEDFAQDNIKVIVSDKEVIDICFDKYLTSRFLQDQQIPAVPTYINLVDVLNEIEAGNLSFPLIVKPRKGSASIGISIVDSVKELSLLLNPSNENDLIVQPFIIGQEYGVDCYIDLITGNPTYIFGKKKIKMRAGETDKSESVIDQNLFKLIEKLIDSLGFIGPIDIDCFKTESGYVISEINPRFGGGYLHAHYSGQNFVKCIINNLFGELNESQIGEYQEGTIMVKFDDFIMLNS